MKRSLPILVLAAATIAGCGTTIRGEVATPHQAAQQASTATATASSAAVGQPIELTNTQTGARADVTLNSVRYRSQPADRSLGEKPRNGTYAIANIRIQAVTGGYDFNSLYFKYQAADGTTFSSLDGNAALAGFEPYLGSGSLSAGQQTRGVVTFDVPSGSGGMVQVTGPMGEVAGEWAIP